MGRKWNYNSKSAIPEACGKADASLASELNNFYGRFEAIGSQ